MDVRVHRMRMTRIEPIDADLLRQAAVAAFDTPVNKSPHTVYAFAIRHKNLITATAARARVALSRATLCAGSNVRGGH
jgi:hypothetical protein